MSLDHRIKDALYALAEDMDRARSLMFAILLRNDEWGQLVSLTCDPSDYLDYDGESFRLDYIIMSCLKRLQIDVGIDREAAALTVFHAGEDQCRITNWRMRAFLSGQNIDHSFITRHVESVRNIVRSILGDLIEEFTFSFSPGVTVSDRFTEPQQKMSTRPTIYSKASDIVCPFWTQTMWYEGIASQKPNCSAPQVVPGNKAMFVPKNAKTDRMISPEASLVISPQQCVGKKIRRGLRKYGIDLTKGQNVHRDLVQWSSSSLAYSTIDIKNASGTVAYYAVRVAVSDDGWFELLDSLRAEHTELPDGSLNVNQQFSSMGNGFTFELETTLFFAICKSVALAHGCKADVLVYGDDIIVPTSIANDVIAALHWWGFETNKDKSFFGDVPFRESCGYDAFNGIPCRPFFVDGDFTTPTEIISLVNAVYRASLYDRTTSGSMKTFNRCWRKLTDHVPKAVRFYGPEFYGDIVIAYHEKTWYTVKYRNYQALLKVAMPVFDDDDITTFHDSGHAIPLAKLAAVCGGFAKDKGLVPGCRNKYSSYTKPRSKPVSSVSAWVSYSLCAPQVDEDSLWKFIVFDEVLKVPVPKNRPKVLHTT